MKIPSRTYVIAEVGVNHNGSLNLAKRLIDEAKEAGADAVKFQTFRAEDLVTAGIPKAAYQRCGQNDGSTQLTMLKRLELSDQNFTSLFRYAKRKKIEFLSTPFDIRSLDFLVKLGIKKIKISSGDLTNGPLLLAAARTRLPVILSTGMGTLHEVEEAMAILVFGYLSSRSAIPVFSKVHRLARSREGRAALVRKVCLLHCTTEYPAPSAELNLRAMDALHEHFGCAVGFSDHSVGFTAAIAAAARGALIIEKHFTLNKDMRGPDHRSSLEPQEFQAMVRGIRTVEAALGNGFKKPSRSEVKNIPIVRKSLVALRAIRKGERFTAKNLTAKRSGSGLSPMCYWHVLDKRAKQDFAKDQKVSL